MFSSKTGPTPPYPKKTLFFDPGGSKTPFPRVENSTFLGSRPQNLALFRVQTLLLGSKPLLLAKTGPGGPSRAPGRPVSTLQEGRKGTFLPLRRVENAQNTIRKTLSRPPLPRGTFGPFPGVPPLPWGGWGRVLEGRKRPSRGREGYLNNPSRVFLARPWEKAVGGGAQKRKGYREHFLQVQKPLCSWNLELHFCWRPVGHTKAYCVFAFSDPQVGRTPCTKSQKFAFFRTPIF